jgi:cobalt-zinc-cadmium efflux system outer membrane protein
MSPTCVDQVTARSSRRGSVLRHFALAVQVASLGLTVASSAFASAEEGTRATEGREPRAVLASLIGAVLAENPAISSADHRVESARHSASAADRLPDPMIGLGYSPVPLETRQGPQRFRASVEQSFPFPGKRHLRREVLGAEALRLEDARDHTAVGVIRGLKKAFWEIYRLDRAVAIAREEMRLLAEIADVVRSRYRTGLGTQANVFQVELMRTRTENRLLILEGMRAEAHEKISAFTGRPIEVPALARLERPLVSWDEARLHEDALHGNPRYLGMEDALHRQELALRLIGKDFYPDLALQAGWLEVGDDGLGGRDSWALGAKISLPLHRGDIRDRLHAQESALRETQRAREDIENHLRSELAGLLARLTAQGASIDLYRTGILPQAESTYESAMAGYATGELEFADLILAEQTLLEVALGLDETVSSYQQLVAELEALLGSTSAESQFPSKVRP